VSIDVALLRSTFRDEVAEHAQTVDDILLRADDRELERDQLDALFRAVHSIKGGCGTFGFKRLGEFAHVLEELLDAVRSRELPLDLEVTDIVLRGNELVRALLAAECDEGTVDPADITVLEAGIAAALSRRTAPSVAAPPAEKRWRISVTVADSARRESVVESLRAAFETLGLLEILDPSESDAWRVDLRTTRSDHELHELFAFIGAAGDECIVTPVADAPEAFGFFDDEPGAPQTAAKPPAARSAERAGVPPETVAGPSKATAAAATIRVGVEKVDHLVNLVGELVIAQSVLTRAAEAVVGPERDALESVVADISRHMRDLREGVMSIRMVPLGTVFGRFRRVCRELEERLGKRVSLRISGEETELDKGMVERLVDPLTHVIRNSLDHGVESREQREAAGKSPVAMVSLSASHQGGEVVIEVSDDGRGLDRDAILARARERGLPVGENPSDEEVWALIFEPGFSTAQSVTDVSGRGVGMDVVRRNVAELGGRVELRSAAGKGTTIRIRLPLTLAILDGLAVRIGGEVYIIPLTAIIESLVPASGSRLRIGAGEVLAFRGDYVPIIPLRERFSEGTAPPIDDVICVVVESGSRRAALEVDALEEQLQAVVKSLEANYRAVPGMAGATVLGNGRVALILDIPGLLGTIA